MGNKVRLPTEVEIDRVLAGKSLASFIKMAWPVLEPTTPLAWGWALDAMCAHLEAVTDGRIKRLLENVPPGFMKSVMTAVMWPAWEWGPKGLDHLRYINTSYTSDLSDRNNNNFRLLVESEWYQERWNVQLRTDQNVKTNFANKAGGFSVSLPFTGLTGFRADRVIVDDPLSVKKASSDVEREAAADSFTKALPTRVNNADSAIVMIMQRLHEEDPSGIVLERNMPYVHLCLPMRYEVLKDKEGNTLARTPNEIGFVDPRSEADELLFPERFPLEVVVELEKSLGSYATAGQLQQRPAPDGGGMFKKEWFRRVYSVPPYCQFVRGWDLAATEGGGDWTCGVKIGRQANGRFIIVDVQREQFSPAGVRKLLRTTAADDGLATKQSLPQDPGQAGKAQAEDLVLHLAGYRAKASTETGSKIVRAQPFAAQVEAGNVDILDAPWTHDFLEELAMFPNGRFDDQVDGATRAFNTLVLEPRFNLEALL